MSQMQQAQNLMLQNLMNNMLPTLPGSPINLNYMFSFLFMNIAHLYAKYRQKNKLLADYCDSMFICLCETYLHEGILDREVQIHYC